MIQTPSFKVVPGRDHYRWITDRGRKIALVGLSGPAYIIDAIHLLIPAGPPVDYDEPEVLHNYTIRGTRLTLGWFQNVIPVKPQLGWDDSDPRCLKMWVDELGPNQERIGGYRFTLQADAERRSYVYEFDSQCRVPKVSALEYVNFTVVGVDDTRSGKTLYPFTIFKNPKEEILRLPRHHCTTSELYDKDVPSGGFISFLGEKENPVIEILESASTTHLNVCMCLHDVHVCGRSFKTDAEEKHEFAFHYRLFGIDAETSRRWVAQSRPQELTDEEAKRFAAFSPRIEIGVNNDMEAGIDVRSDNGSFYFERQESGWESTDFWESERGYSGRRCARIRSSVQGRRSLGVSGGQLFVTPEGSVDLRARVRGEGLSGRGAFLEAEFGRWDGSKVQTTLVAQSSRVTGGADWTSVELSSVPVPEGSEYVWVRLVLEGPGTAWFDDLLIRVKEPLAAMALPIPAQAERVSRVSYGSGEQRQKTRRNAT